MSKFGIDIDDVIFKTSDALKTALDESNDPEILEHKLDIMRGEAVNPKVGQFMKVNVIPTITVARPMEDVSEVIRKLKEQSHEIVLITARGDERFPGSEEITHRRLKENGIEYDSIIFNSLDKVKICNENNIDIFIDDSPKHCKEVSENLGIPVIGFESEINKEEMIKNNIRCVSSWKELDSILNDVLKEAKEKIR